MPSISVFRRKWKDRTGKERIAKKYSAQIRFGSAAYLRSTGATNEREAQAVARRLAKEIEEKELPRRGVEILTVDAMFSRWIVEHGKELRSGKNIAWQIKLILHLIGGAREVRNLGNKDVNGFVQDAKAAGKGPVTINRCLETFRAVMNYAADRWEEPVRRISWKTFRQKEAKAREVYLSPEEARRLMEILPPHIAICLAFTLYTGVRLKELETLIWDRVDEARGVCMVETKGGGLRAVWLSAKALKVLEMAENGLPRAIKVFDTRNRRKHWEHARKQIGREDVHWHDLRAMTATWARQHSSQKDLSLIGRALGHSGTAVTERYARVVDREVVEMLDQLPDITPERKRMTA